MKKLLKQLIPQRVWMVLRDLEKRVRRMICCDFLWALHFHHNGLSDLTNIALERNDLTANQLILAYAQGIFACPFHTGEIRWYDPEVRTIIPLDGVHIPKRFRSYLNKGEFEIRFNTNFRGVLDGCAAPGPGRQTTFMIPKLLTVLEELHERGVAHSVEAYKDGELVGGLYGVAIGGMFSVSSMFHSVDNASKIALIYLVELLRRNGYVLLDTWWKQPHFIAFGGVGIPRKEYKERVAEALTAPAAFRISAEPITVDYREYN